MARKRAENREGSLGFPGFVKPVFTKDSKPLGRSMEKITRARNVKPRLTSPVTGPAHGKMRVRLKNSLNIRDTPQPKKFVFLHFFAFHSRRSSLFGHQQEPILERVSLVAEENMLRARKEVRIKIDHDKLINKLQNYYGITIRSNVGNLEDMQKAVIAEFFIAALVKTSRCIVNALKMRTTGVNSRV
ncbi:hypothetical protein TNCV_3610351 [Trichonephila clavipes]|nr:hypothetical protein TNCV_3610351 [Trichonephila clavipes]